MLFGARADNLICPRRILCAHRGRRRGVSAAPFARVLWGGAKPSSRRPPPPPAAISSVLDEPLFNPPPPEPQCRFPSPRSLRPRGLRHRRPPAALTSTRARRF